MLRQVECEAKLRQEQGEYMKKFLFIAGLSFASLMHADPGIMIDIDIIFERPSGPGGVVMGEQCK